MNNTTRAKAMSLAGRWILAGIWVAMSSGALYGQTKTGLAEPFRSPLPDARLEEELTGKQVLSAISGITVQRFEKGVPALTAAELDALALAYYHLKDEPRALELYKEAVALAPDDPLVLTDCSVVLHDQGQAEEAIELLRKLLDTPQRGQALTKLARCYLKAERYGEAYLLVPELLKFKFDHENLGLRALLHYARTAPDGDTAKEVLLRAIEDVPDEYLAHDFELGARACLALERCGLGERSATIKKRFDAVYKTLPAFAARADAFAAGLREEATTVKRAESMAGGGAEHLVLNPNGPIVRRIEVQSNNPYTTITPAAVIASMETKVGQPYAERVVEDDIRNLYATGVISNTRIFGESLPDGVKIIVVIHEEVTR
jgi:tetratricopeptide (TPR) repeat protein